MTLASSREQSLESFASTRSQPDVACVRRTIDAPTAARLGKPYRQNFDGVTNISTVEGPILRENGSYADYPAEVAQWYERIARATLKALQSPCIHTLVAGDDELWAGSPLELVAQRSAH